MKTTRFDWFVEETRHARLCINESKLICSLADSIIFNASAERIRIFIYADDELN